jgi:hypothetical protein
MFDRDGRRRSQFWTTARIHRAGLLAVVAGVVYAIGVPAVPGVPLTGSRLLAALAELCAVVSLLAVLGAVHARYGHIYGERGRRVWLLTVATMAGVVLGAALALLPPLGVATPELATARFHLRTSAPLVVAMCGTAYGVVLWRAGASRPGSALLGINAVVGFGSATLLGAWIGPHLAATIPFGLAWSLVGHSLWADHAMPPRLRPKKPNAGQ